MAEQNKVVVEAAAVSESSKALAVIKAAISGIKDLNLDERPSETGVSFFAGKDRLCKLLKTKRGVTLEINVSLPKKLSDLPEMDTISTQMANKKHLGTMKHLYRSNDSKMIKEIITEALLALKAKIDAKKAEESKEVKQEEQIKKEA